jgi:hypothetical protein
MTVVMALMNPQPSAAVALETVTSRKACALGTTGTTMTSTGQEVQLLAVWGLDRVVTTQPEVGISYISIHRHQGNHSTVLVLQVVLVSLQVEVSVL